jgi:hypothetical protein
MKTLSNNKGISLVILIVVMTLIAILGASFVSLMGSKQKGFLYQINSYRALNIANAGVEFAIRYVSDGLSDTTDPDNTFFNNPSASITRGFAGGTFVFTYYHDYNNDGNNNDSTVVATGDYPATHPVSRREIRMSNFRHYLRPITLIPVLGNRPRINPINTAQVFVPIICNNDNTIFVTQIDITVNAVNVYLYLYRDGTNVFAYDDSGYPACGASPTNRCKDIDSFGRQRIYLGNDPASPITFVLLSSGSNNSYVTNIPYTHTLEFSSSPAPTGQYTVTFNPQLSTVSGSIVFIPDPP